MARRLVRTDQAEQDWLDIWLFVAENDIGAADRLLNQIDVACQLLTDFPYLGKARPDIRSGLRHAIVGRYVILYQIEADKIEVVRLVHGARHLPGVLDD